MTAHRRCRERVIITGPVSGEARISDLNGRVDETQTTCCTRTASRIGACGGQPAIVQGYCFLTRWRCLIIPDRGKMRKYWEGLSTTRPDSGSLSFGVV